MSMMTCYKISTFQGRDRGILQVLFIILISIARAQGDHCMCQKSTELQKEDKRSSFENLCDKVQPEGIASESEDEKEERLECRDKRVHNE